MNRYKKAAVQLQINEVAMDVRRHLKAGGEHGLWHWEVSIDNALTKRFKSWGELLATVSLYYAYDCLEDLLDDVYDLREM